MLTVKVVDGINGNVTIKEAKSIEAMHFKDGSNMVLYTPSGENKGVWVTNGEVYVLNENGKFVDGWICRPAGKFDVYPKIHYDWIHRHS